jgi:hypothetical protein
MFLSIRKERSAPGHSVPFISDALRPAPAVEELRAFAAAASAPPSAVPEVELAASAVASVSPVVAQVLLAAVQVAFVAALAGFEVGLVSLVAAWA